jgi:hypothetical protein
MEGVSSAEATGLAPAEVHHTMLEHFLAGIITPAGAIVARRLENRSSPRRRRAPTALALLALRLAAHLTSSLFSSWLLSRPKPPQLLRGLYSSKAGEYIRSFFSSFCLGSVTVAELAWLLEYCFCLLIPHDLEVFIGFMLRAEAGCEQAKRPKKPRLSTRLVLPITRPQRSRRLKRPRPTL